MKGSMLRLSAAALAGVLFAAATAQADMMTKVGPGEGEVDIVAWPGYIERGANDKNYDWVTDFEKQTGCKVNAKTAGTSDEMVSLMNGGGFDLVTASGDATRAAHRRQDGAGGQYRPDPELEDPRPAAAERRLAYGGRPSLRRALSVGAERADVQHQGLQGSAEELERRLRGDDACPTASRTRAGSRPITGRSTSPMRPSI